MAVSETIGHEAVLFGISILVGAGLFLFYDSLRIFRRILPHGNIAIGVEDFFYWLVCTGTVFVMLYRENDGRVRGFALLGLGIGMLLYYLLLSRYIISIHVLVLKKVLWFLQKVFGRLFGPGLRAGKKGGQFFKKELKKLLRAVRIGLCKR